MNRQTKWLMVVITVASWSAQAATRTWLSSVGGLWTSTANWSDSTLPGANDIADLSAATGTINLTADAVVGEILYNPPFSGTTNTLTILSDTAAPSSRTLTMTTTATRRVQVGEGAQLLMDADLKPSGVLLKNGYGSLVIKRRLPPPARCDFRVEQGRMINEGAIVIPGGRLHVGTVEPETGASPEFVMRVGSSYFATSASSDLILGGNSLLASGPGSKGVITHEGGILDLTTNTTGGVFLNGYAAGGTCVYNLMGGEVNLPTKTVYPGFNGTGTVNQTGGKMRAVAMNFSSTATGRGIYNLTGGELWLGGIAQKGSGTAVFNLGGGCVYPLNTGFNIYDNTSPRLTGTNGQTRFCSTGSGFTNSVSGLSGSGGFVKEGADTLNIAGSAHSFTGPVIISNGTVNVGQAMNGNNAVLIAGGSLNLSAGVSVKYSSLLVTGGVFQVASNAYLTLAGSNPSVRVAGSGTIRFLAGATLPGLAALDVSESGAIDLTAGGRATVNRLIVNGVEQAHGLYTAATCTAITGGGTLVVNGGRWTGAGDDNLWSTGMNWLAGIVPNGVQAVADLSGAVSNSVPITSLVLDLAAVTNNDLVLASGVAGAILTNTCPPGVTNTLYVPSEGVIHVGEGETLVLDHNVCLMGNYIYKRGGGTLVLRRRTFALPSLVTLSSTITLGIEGGTVICSGPMTNVLVMVGKPDRSVPGTTPEFILEDTPDAAINGTSFIASMNYLATSLNPGNGIFTQKGGMVTPGISWLTKAQIGFAVSGATLGGTGIYHLVNGTLSMTNSLALAVNNGRGYLNQSGGVLDLYSFTPAGGAVNLTGGLLKLDNINNSGSSPYCTFNLGAGRLEPKNTTVVTIASPTVFTDEKGSMTFAPASGRAITVSGATSGSGGFVKDGEGTLTFSGTSSFSGTATISNGTLTVSGSLAGTNDVLLAGGTFSVSANASAKLGSLSVTNGTVSLASGVVATAERLFIEGLEWAAGVYAATNCAKITGAGVLIVGAEPGQWTNGGGDGKWSTAANWVAGLIPNGPYAVSDLSAAVSNMAPVRTLVMDFGSFTNKQVLFNSGVADAVLTNTCPDGVTNTLYLVSGGVLEVGEGQTLVLDHDLCIMGNIFKRGRGTLILRRRTYALPSLVAPGSMIYLYVDSGKVINEGPMANILVSVGKLSRSDAGKTPEFIMADTPDASLGGTSFITAINSLATEPGPGIFTQNGGTVNPAINWGVRMALGHTTAFVNVPGTGTYNLVKGTLTVTNELRFGRNGSVSDGHYGIFNQSGGTADLQTLSGTWGEVRLTGGLFKLNALSTAAGPNSTFYFGGGRFEPKTTAPVIILNPTVFTAVGGDMTFGVEAGRSVRLSGATTGSGGFIKEGAGQLLLSATNAFSGTAQIKAGTCTVSTAASVLLCTNLVIEANAHLALQRSGEALNTNLWLKVAADGKVHLDFTGEVMIGHLILNGYEWPGRGRRYGSSSHTSELDKVMDAFFTGTGVLKVVGPHGMAGTLMTLR